MRTHPPVELGIAVEGAQRINDCWHNLSAELARHPAIDGDEQFYTSHFDIVGSDGVRSAEDLAIIHEHNSADLAYHIMAAAIAEGELATWLRLPEGEVRPDRQVLGRLDRRSFTRGIVCTPGGSSPLDGRPLWVKDGDWRRFVGRTLSKRQQSASSAVVLPPLSDSKLNQWANSLDDRQRLLSQTDLLALCRVAHPENSVSRQRIRDIFAGGKPGPRKTGGEVTAGSPPH